MDMGLIPKCFRIKATIPGDSKGLEEDLKEISIKSMKGEILKHENNTKLQNTYFKKQNWIYSNALMNNLRMKKFKEFKNI